MVCQAPGCGKTFEAKRKNAAYCSTKCRQRGYRAKLNADPTPAKPGRAKPVRRRRGPGPVEKFTRQELTDAGKLGTSAAQVAMKLAQRLDGSDVETGAAAAALAREHAASMARALGGEPPDDPVKARADEVGRRRAERKAQASGGGR